MRWSQQTIEAEERASLPGYRDEAVVRHFEAPDSVPTRFYEVRAKSVLNRVPEASRMPFRWTINPFRGCTHACTYCLGPETQILLADGRTKPIADLNCGEQIYGTQIEGRYRRLRVTTVHGKWSSIKRAFILELADGTKILTSGDHRFLTRRGWKHVLGDDHGLHPRPHLTRGSKLTGTGGFSDQPIVSRSVDGMALKDAAALEVVSIQATGTVERLYDITTGTGDFIAEGVVSHNCFARPTHTYLDLDAGQDFEREIVVKVNAPERLRVELRRPSWKGEHVALGTNTDPYQWVEGRYKLMRGIWQAMIDARNPGSVLTKSPLLLRDLDLMLELNRRADFSAALSIPTIDEQAWRATEPHTPNPRARMEAVAKLTAAGIRTGVLVAPLMPGINDDPEQVREILRLCSEAGAAYVTGIALHLRSGVRQVFMEWLRSERPELVDRYRELYRRGAYAPAGERRRLAALLERSQRPPEGEWARGRRIEPPPRTPPKANAPAGGQERLFDLY